MHKVIKIKLSIGYKEILKYYKKMVFHAQSHWIDKKDAF